MVKQDILEIWDANAICKQNRIFQRYGMLRALVLENANAKSKENLEF